MRLRIEPEHCFFCVVLEVQDVFDAPMPVGYASQLITMSHCYRPSSRLGLTILESFVTLTVCTLILIVVVPVCLVRFNVMQQTTSGKINVPDASKEPAPIYVAPIPSQTLPKPPEVPGIDSSGRLIIEGQPKSKSPDEVKKP
jgi:hypothetical protein